MAVLADGVQYGLSSHGLSSENKSLVFVKLTDSSFRAIEEYLRTKSKSPQSPSIQFLANEGRLWFPNGEGGGGSAFKFSLQPAVAHGSQGSFECVQQCGSRSLESLGVMTLKMNVQAKEDVYEATRQRMAVAEEESKKNCTRVIKLACGPDIGRVVKIRKQAGSVFPPRREREDASPSQHSSHRSSSSSSTYSSSSTHHSHAPTGRSSTSSPSLGGPGGGAAAAGSNGSGRSSNAISPLPRSSASPSYSASTASSINSSTTSSGTKDGYANGGPAGETNPELMRRPLRERIIHLLAIRPHKKPELISRLHREGIKEKDKKLIMSILMAVALMKEQAYHLARHIWNDVQDDWPFYTNEEKSILKRRKPQNLTPPVSDSSTGSGNSPPSNSLHSSGSPIRTSSSSKTNASPRESGVKRSMPQLEPEFDDMAGAALAAKKQRVSHYKKPDSSQQPVQQQQHQQPPQPQPPPPQHHSAPYQARDSRTSSSFKSRPPSGYQQTQQPPRDHYQREQAPYNKQRGHDQYNGHGSRESHNQKDYYRNETRPAPDRQPTSRMADNPGPETPNSSPESVERMDTMDEPEPYPDYTQLYQRIVSCEQRSRYKEDFNSQYNEYRDLHKIIDRVSKRFAQLEEELRQECEGSTEWQRIKDRIVREYKENLRDAKFLETKRRFHHLHEKLAYIKRLVVEWDTAQTCRS